MGEIQQDGQAGCPEGLGCNRKTLRFACSRFSDIGAGLLVTVLCVVSLTAMVVTTWTKGLDCWEHLSPVVGGLFNQMNPLGDGENTCTRDKTKQFDQKCNSSMPHVFLKDYKCFHALTEAKQADWQKWNKGLDKVESVIHKRAEGDKQMVDDMQKIMKAQDPTKFTFKFEGTGPDQQDWGAHTWGAHLLDTVLPEHCVDACYDKARKESGETPLTVCNDEILSQAVGEGAICSGSVKTIVVNGSCDIGATVAATAPMLILLIGLATFLLFSCLPGRRLLEWQAPTILQRTTLVIYALVVQLVIAASYLFDISYRGSDGVFEAAEQHASCQPIDEGLAHPRNKRYECVMMQSFSLASVFKALALIGGSTAIFPQMIDFLDRWIFRLQEEDNKDKEFKCLPATGHCCKLRIPKSIIKVSAFALSVIIVLGEQTVRLYYELGLLVFHHHDQWLHDQIPSNKLKNLYMKAGSSQDPVGVLEIEIISKLPVILATACLLQKSYYWQAHVAKLFPGSAWFFTPKNTGRLAPEGKQEGEGVEEPRFGFPSFALEEWDASNKKEEAMEFVEKDGTGKIFVENKKKKGSKMDSELAEGADLELFGGPAPAWNDGKEHHCIKGGNYKLELSPCGKIYAYGLIFLSVAVFFVGYIPFHKGVIQALGIMVIVFFVGALLVVLVDWWNGGGIKETPQLWFKKVLVEDKDKEQGETQPMLHT